MFLVGQLLGQVAVLNRSAISAVARLVLWQSGPSPNRLGFRLPRSIPADDKGGKMKFRVGRFTCEVLLSDDGKPLVRWAPERPKYLNRAERDQYQAGLAEFLERLNPRNLGIDRHSNLARLNGSGS